MITDHLIVLIFFFTANDAISAFKKGNLEFKFENETLKIKINGDGAKSQKSTYVLLSCALLQKQDEVISAKGNHTIAVVNGSEKYET